MCDKDPYYQHYCSTHKLPVLPKGMKARRIQPQPPEKKLFTKHHLAAFAVVLAVVVIVVDFIVTTGVHHG
jgi:hypothetical protein